MRRLNPERQRRYARHLVRKNSYQDRNLGESVNVTPRDDIWGELKTAFGRVCNSVVLEFTVGEVLADSRGDGTLQRDNDDGQWKWRG